VWQSEKSKQRTAHSSVRVVAKNQIKKKQLVSNDESRVDSLIQRLVRKWLAEQETSLSANRIQQFVAWVGADAERRGSVILRRLTARYGRSLVRDNWRSWPGRPSG